MIQRPVPWPNGAKVAVAITLDMDADSLVHIDHPKDSITRLSTISTLKYGPEVGIPRILDTFKRFELTKSFFIPAWCIEQYPKTCLLYTSPSPRDRTRSRMPSSA